MKTSREMAPDGLDLRLRLLFHLRVLRPAAVLALLVTTLLSTGASADATGPDDVPTFVTPPKRPTEVAVASYLIGLSRVSDSSEAFHTIDVEMFLDLSWKDPRLAFEGESPHVFQGEEAEEKLSEIWSADPEIQNEVEQRETESVELILLPDGTIQYEERFGATLHAQLDLGRFPFDTQAFDLDLHLPHPRSTQRRALPVALHDAALLRHGANREERVAALDRRTRWILPVVAALALSSSALLVWS